MLVRHKGMFNTGILLAISFLGVLALIFSPLFGGGKNGLEYSDDLFNKLSKGSSYFIPDITKKVQKFAGKEVSFTVKTDKADAAAKVFMATGAQVGTPQGGELKLTADLGKLLAAVLADADSMYHNKGSEVVARYPGMDEKAVLKLEWDVLNKAIKELQKEKKIDEANVINDVLKKGVEPAYNFYKIPAEDILGKAWTVVGLLVFYVVYTMWWGYAIFYLFDGIGLSMKKAKVKKEV
jgi:hypothetical protein